MASLAPASLAAFPAPLGEALRSGAGLCPEPYREPYREPYPERFLAVALCFVLTVFVCIRAITRSTWARTEDRRVEDTSVNNQPLLGHEKRHPAQPERGCVGIELPLEELENGDSSE